MATAFLPGTFDSSAGREWSGTHSVPAVEKLFSVLEVLAGSQTDMTVRDLAKACNLPKSSVHGIVITLERCGYLRRNQRSSRYLFGRKLLSLANNAVSGLELRELAEPLMRGLARTTQLSVQLGIVESYEAVVVAKVDYSPGPCPAWIGKRMCLHSSALGKALIAQWTGPELGQLIEARSLPRHNDNTISSLKGLHEELAKTRRVGYAIDDEEDVLGFRSVSAAVCDRTGATIAAVAVSGTVSDITAENAPFIGLQLRAAVTKIQCALKVAD